MDTRARLILQKCKIIRNKINKNANTTRVANGVAAVQYRVANGVAEVQSRVANGVARPPLAVLSLRHWFRGLYV